MQKDQRNVVGQDSTAVLVVGAGPTGLTMAVSLARSGIPFRVIDAEPGPRPGSRGKGVQPRSLEIFEDLGIASRVIANGQLAMPMNSTGPDGRVVHGGAIPESLRDRPDIPYAASLITPEWRVEEALRLRLEELGGRVEFGTELVSLSQDDDGVKAEIVSGGVTSTITSRWLVGADGGHSVTRKQIGATFVGETREDVRVTIADLPVTGLSREAWETWRHPEGLLSLSPLPSTDLFQYIASLAPGAEPRLDLPGLQATLERRTGRSDIRLHEPVWTSVWRANVRLVEHYRVGNVFLAGDAAHIHSPAGGQGMNTGVQDGYNLAWKLAAVVGNNAPVELLDTYESERRPVAMHVLAQSNARLAETIKTNGLPVKRDASTIELDVGYRGSELASDDRNDQSSLRAGDRAPDATGLTTTGGRRRLFDLIGGGLFTLLSFGPTTLAGLSIPGLRILHVVPEPQREGEIADDGRNLVRSYEAAQNTLVVIRPDGYIGLISDAGDSDTVSRYLLGFASGDVQPGASQSPVRLPDLQRI
ncbi:FAD-dependent oxidoreductase [Microbacterium sp. STN6]|uniref:FAD-dependent oxidoreductase n=1 Tax=Microbacterium sp. STN6 TaxID=2995588 RepID=UPI002260CB21|nr:FAD-dependent oxidoreductase [Microbacterium sp. STN6]MCX7523092.1 FAD-dependent oxidoreductase [Microbacterium sp. STN6]